MNVRTTQSIVSKQTIKNSKEVILVFNEQDHDLVLIPFDQKKKHHNLLLTTKH